jgi:hypothetical protein
MLQLRWFKNTALTRMSTTDRNTYWTSRTTSQSNKKNKQLINKHLRTDMSRTIIAIHIDAKVIIGV